MSTAAPEPKANMGQPVPRYDAMAKVTGKARYGSDVPLVNPAYAYLVTSGHSPSFSGRKASLPGTVATYLTRSHSPFDSSGVLACIRYMSRMTRPSLRMLPFLVMKALIGILRISARTALASSVPAALTALR